jgi:FdhD protein
MDAVAAEEPLAIRIQHWRKDALFSENLAVTMRTPGADYELAAGLLLTEGVIRNRSDIADIRHLGLEPRNEILIELARHVDFEEWRQRRNGFVSSSCGVCGKASIEQICPILPSAASSDWRVTPGFIASLPAAIQTFQTTFNETGGVHAAAVVALDGAIQGLFEDIGRHNALDKVVGHATLQGWLPLNRHVLFMSSRSSFELIQKAAMAGAWMLASVGSPSSLAIETARQVGLTLICFVRNERFNVYSGDWRLDW